MRLKGSGRLIALTLVAAVALLALLVVGAAGKGKPPHKPSAKNGRAGFHFRRQLQRQPGERRRDVRSLLGRHRTARDFGRDRNVAGDRRR